MSIEKLQEWLRIDSLFEVTDDDDRQIAFVIYGDESSQLTLGDLRSIANAYKGLVAERDGLLVLCEEISNACKEVVEQNSRLQQLVPQLHEGVQGEYFGVRVGNVIYDIPSLLVGEYEAAKQELKELSNECTDA